MDELQEVFSTQLVKDASSDEGLAKLQRDMEWAGYKAKHYERMYRDARLVRAILALGDRYGDDQQNNIISVVRLLYRLADIDPIRDEVIGLQIRLKEAVIHMAETKT
jgi:hypothetical protein